MAASPKGFFEFLILILLVDIWWIMLLLCVGVLSIFEAIDAMFVKVPAGFGFVLLYIDSRPDRASTSLLLEGVDSKVSFRGLSGRHGFSPAAEAGFVFFFMIALEFFTVVYNG